MDLNSGKVGQEAISFNFGSSFCEDAIIIEFSILCGVYNNKGKVCFARSCFAVDLAAHIHVSGGLRRAL
jgi:hypothetical protein